MQTIFYLTNLGYCSDGSMQGIPSYSSAKSSKKKSRIRETVRKAAIVASATAKHVYAAGESQSSDKTHPLKCCLMSISLPWECIAYDLLFKVRISISQVLKCESCQWSLNSLKTT